MKIITEFIVSEKPMFSRKVSKKSNSPIDPEDLKSLPSAAISKIGINKANPNPSSNPTKIDSRIIINNLGPT
jgi:hypothetical protein